MIDRRIPEEWPTSVLDAMRQWRQGYVVESPPFFYQRSEANPIWSIAIEPDDVDEESPVILDPPERAAFGLVTTQTCDLFEEGRPRQPWFAVAPIYDMASDLKPGQLGQLQRGWLGHLVMLTAGWLPPGHWVADLRIEVPIEKGWLVGREPRPGFASVRDYERLAARLASRRGRSALSKQLTTYLTSPLRDWLRGTGRASRDRLDSIRVRIAGDPAVSTHAEVLVISGEDGLTPEDVAAWGAWEASQIEAAEAEGVILHAFRYGGLDDFSARDVETSVRLDLDYLSPDP